MSEKICYRTTHVRIFGQVAFRSRTDASTIVTTVRAHVANNSVSVNDVPLLIATVYGALAGLGDTQGHASAVPSALHKQAVTVRASIKPDRLICLEDGLSMTMLKRHLNTHHQMTPAQYCAKWKLPRDYPMVAPDDRAMRSALAKQIGLGRKPGQKAFKPKVSAKS